MTISETSAKNVTNMVYLAIKHKTPSKAVVIFDSESSLSRLLTEAYRTALPNGLFLDFNAVPPEEIIAHVRALVPHDLVILVQSSNFRLAEFRFRIELFQRGIATIEHVHLGRMPDSQIEAYVDSLAYDPSYYVSLGHALKEQIDRAEIITVHCPGTVLTYEGGMEPTKLNVGDYTGMNNVGGTFPIGEVFSEPKDLSMVNGEAMLFAFAGTDHLIKVYEPFKIIITAGIVTGHEGPAEFQAVLDQISTDEKILVREFGLGLNPSYSKHRVVDDITAFERQKGLHFSLGEKHGIYKKPGFKQKKTHYHIDVFVEVERIEFDGEVVFTNGKYSVENSLAIK